MAMKRAKSGELEGIFGKMSHFIIKKTQLSSIYGPFINLTSDAMGNVV